LEKDISIFGYNLSPYKRKTEESHFVELLIVTIVKAMSPIPQILLALKT
jgi:hypothetical protein